MNTDSLYRFLFQQRNVRGAARQIHQRLRRGVQPGFALGREQHAVQVGVDLVLVGLAIAALVKYLRK